MQEITITELVKLTGKSQPTINKRLALSEITPLRITGRKKLYDSTKALQAIFLNKDEWKYLNELDLSQERAKLAVEQTRKIKLQNDIEEKNYAHVDELSDALQSACTIIASHLEALPLTLKKRNPNLTGKDIEIVRKEIAKCRNAAATAVIESGK